MDMIKNKTGKRVLAVAMTVLLLCSMAAVPSGKARAAGMEPYVDISTDIIALSPQAAEVKMNVAARNMPENTQLAVSVADGNICSVAWVDPGERGYVQLCYKRGEALGETVATIYVADNPAIARQIRVTNKDVADSYAYEGEGNMDFSVNMVDLPYAVHAVNTDKDGYFGLIYNNTAGETQVLVNTAGAYDGTVAILHGTNGMTFHVLATGHWQITMTPVLEVSVWSQSGSGSTVTGRFTGDNSEHSVYCVNYAPKGNFIVWLYDINDDTRWLLANGAGAYGTLKKDVYLNESHTYYYSVQSEGNWMVEFR